MKLLMYLIYGDKTAYFHEAKYSILSAMKYLTSHDEDIKIIVVTEHPESFANFPVLIEEFDGTQFKEWVGDNGYHHRVKNRAMATILNKYQCPLVFIDTDTYFIDHPAKLFDRISTKESLLFMKETLISSCPDIYPYLQGTSFSDYYGNLYQFPDNATMWNSGVVGLLPEHLILLDEAVVLLDNFYRLTEGKVIVVEQLALSEILRIKTKLNSCQDIIVHYFGKKNEFYDKQLSYYFSHFDEQELINSPQEIDKLKLSMPRPSNFFRFRKKLKLTLKGITDKDLMRGFLELEYAQYNYQTPVEKIAQEVWFSLGIRHLSEVSDKYLNKRYTSILKKHTSFLENSEFKQLLASKFQLLIKKFNHL